MKHAGSIKEIKSCYGVVVTDPPWKQTKGGLRSARPNQGRSLDYKTTTLEDIEENQKYVAEHLSEASHSVFMWTIDKFLFEAETMMQRLNYRRHARLIWDKTNGVAPAFTVRYSHEYLLWFYGGKFQSVDTSQRGKFTTVFREKSREHSRKPEVAYSFIEKMYPTATRLEMYARNSRPGWDSWGFEVDKFDADL